MKHAMQHEKAEKGGRLGLNKLNLPSVFKFSRNKESYLMISVIAHIMFVMYAYWLGMTYVLVSLFAGLVAFNLAYSIYSHRVLAHSHFKINSFYHKLFCTLYSAINFGSVAIGVGVHVKHHQYSDTDLDPHNPRRLGILRTMLKLWDGKYKPNRKTFVRLMKIPAVRQQHKTHVMVSFISMLFLPALIVAGFWLSNLLIVAVHIPALGYKRCKTDDSVNVPFLKPLLWGEELHSNHHVRADLANHNHAKNWIEFDLIYYLGKLISENGVKLDLNRLGVKGNR